jgi:DNA-binding winged helix-turn-helix (wHTH) protein
LFEVAVPLQCYKFGDFELDCARFELRLSGHPVKLERIPLELLILLAEKGGNVVTRQEISEKVWGKEVFVDTEHGINTAIRKVRSALQEDGDSPTLYKRFPEKATVSLPRLKTSAAMAEYPERFGKPQTYFPAEQYP